MTQAMSSTKSISSISIDNPPARHAHHREEGVSIVPREAEAHPIEAGGPWFPARRCSSVARPRSVDLQPGSYQDKANTDDEAKLQPRFLRKSLRTTPSRRDSWKIKTDQHTGGGKYKTHNCGPFQKHLLSPGSGWQKERLLVEGPAPGQRRPLVVSGVSRLATGSLAMSAAIRLASSRVRRCAAALRPGSSSK